MKRIAIEEHFYTEEYVDYPLQASGETVEFIDAAPISDTDKEKIYHLNAEKLLGL